MDKRSYNVLFIRPCFPWPVDLFSGIEKSITNLCHKTKHTHTHTLNIFFLLFSFTYVCFVFSTLPRIVCPDQWHVLSMWTLVYLGEIGIVTVQSRAEQRKSHDVIFFFILFCLYISVVDSNTNGVDSSRVGFPNILTFICVYFLFQRILTSKPLPLCPFREIFSSFFHSFVSVAYFFSAFVR